MVLNVNKSQTNNSISHHTNSKENPLKFLYSEQGKNQSNTRWIENIINFFNDCKWP